MIKSHEINTIIGHPSLSDLEGFLSEAISLTDQMVSLLNAVKEFETNRDDDLLLDEIDTAAVFQFTGLSIFSDCHLSTCISINRYLGKTLVDLTSLREMLNKYSMTAMTPVDDNEPDGLHNFEALIKKCIAGVTHFICYEFNLYDYVQQATSDSGNADIDEVYYSVINKSGFMDALTKAVELCALSLKFKQKLEIFDQYPEKERIFEQLMGPYAAEMNEANLTIELVDALLDGKITPDQLLSATNPELDDDGGEYDTSDVATEMQAF